MDPHEMVVKLMEDIINKGSNAHSAKDPDSYLNLEGDPTNTTVDPTNIKFFIVNYEVMIVMNYVGFMLYICSELCSDICFSFFALVHIYIQKYKYIIKCKYIE
jgi:hypothetical protein